MKIINSTTPNPKIVELNQPLTVKAVLADEDKDTRLRILISGNAADESVIVDFAKFDDISFLKDFSESAQMDVLLSEIKADINRHLEYMSDCLFDIRDYNARWQLRAFEQMSVYAVHFLMSQSK